MSEQLKTLIKRGIMKFILEFIVILWSMGSTMLLAKLFGDGLAVIFVALAINITIAAIVNYYGSIYADKWFEYFD